MDSPVMVWKACSNVAAIPVVPPFEHKQVNHAKEFVTECGHHANNIEATWAVLKKAMPVRYRNKKYLQAYLHELMWRSKHKGCQWEALLSAMGNVQYEAKSHINHSRSNPEQIDERILAGTAFPTDGWV